MPTIITTLIVAATLALGGCASTTRQSVASPVDRAARYTLTVVELEASGSMNLYDAIEKLRPEFLRSRGTGTISAVPMPTSTRGQNAPAGTYDNTTGTAVPVGSYGVRVYENDILLGGLEDLKRIDVKSVLEVRYVPGPEAGVRFGTNHSAGVIFVKSR